jgi:signal transduction histidine kinase
MRRRLTLSIVVTLVTAAAVTVLWLALVRADRERVARIAEATSYGSRSELVRRLETRSRALRDLAELWATYGRQPVEEWTSDVQIEPAHFAGTEAIAWEDPIGNVRFFTSAPDLELHRRPTEDEWSSLGDAPTEAAQLGSESIIGPYRGNDGHVEYRLYVPVEQRGESRGILIAIVDAHEVLEDAFRDEAPGYAISVYWKGEEIFRRGEPSGDIPEAWAREGWIELSTGAKWRVVHAPQRALRNDLTSGAVGGVLGGGLVIALLLGALTYESGSSRARALAAKRAEEELRILNLELEERIARRTEELDDALRDLRIVQESVSHDIRTPLGAIVQFVELLHRTSDGDDRSAEYLRRIESSVRNAVGIADQLLAVSLANGDSLRLEPVDVGALVREVFAELVADRHDAQPPRLELDDLPTTLADPTLLRSVLANLLGNAIKFSRNRPQSPVRVGATIEGNEVVYFVADRGIGIEEAYREEIFKASVRLPAAAGVAGKGLGLAIAKRIVDRHGGRIWAEGNEDGGTTFKFTMGLPRFRRDAPSQEVGPRCL